MALKTTIVANNVTIKNILQILPNWGIKSDFKHSVNKARLFTLLILLVSYSFKMNAQCTLTGTTVDSRTVTCSSLSGCTIVYIGDGVSPTSLVMYQNLDLTCLGAIQLIIRNNANIDFSNGNYDLRLGANSSIIVENGGNISAGSNCSSSDLIWIGGEKVASCTGAGPSVISFPNLVTGGGYNTVNATSTIVCGSGASTITAFKNPRASNTTYKIYTLATGGTPIQTTTIALSSDNFIYTTTNISATTNYYIEATTGTITTLRRQVTVTVVPIPTITGTSPNSRCGTGTVTLGATASAGTIKWYAASTGGSSLGTGTSFTTPSIATTTTYYVDATNNGCTTGTRTAVIASVNSTNTWNGSVSTDWDDPSNWSCGVPTPNSDIIIPSGITTQYPTLSYDLTLRNVDIQNGASIIVYDNGLTITGTLTLNGKIDLQNESQLIQTEESTLVSDCATGGIEIDQQGTSNSYHFNYWGSPVNSSCGPIKNNIEGFLRNSNGATIDFESSLTYADGAPTTPIKLSTYWMNKFTNKPADYKSWTHIGKNGILNPGEGFTMKGSNGPKTQDQNYTFKGIPNNGTIILTINQDMQYLVGNPYSSAIDANEFINNNLGSIDGTLYFWDHAGPDSHYLKDYGLGYATYNLSGGIPAGGFIGGLPPPGRKIPQRFIPVAQGFFVNASGNGGSIQFNNNQRVFVKEGSYDAQLFIRTTEKNNSKNKSEEREINPKIYLKYNTSSGFERKILMAFNPNTTDGIDYGYDARNIDQFKEDLFWKTANTKLVIQAVPTIDNRVLPLEVKVATKGNVKISIDRFENIPEDISILLKDKENGILSNLRTTAFEINLNPGTYTNRFELVLRTQQTLAIDEENIVDNSINIYLNNTENTIFINNRNLFEIKEISIYNMLGQQIQSIKKGLEYQSIKIPFNIQSGVYIVNVTTDKGSVSKKIIKF